MFSDHKFIIKLTIRNKRHHIFILIWLSKNEVFFDMLVA